MLSPDLLLHAYASGFFPMGDPDSGEIRWYSPDPRAILPLEELHVPRTLRKLLRRGDFQVTTDHAFEEVIRGCAEPAPDRPSTWITPEVMGSYLRLHELGFAHSVEYWDEGELAGGLYGVALGGAYFGESMFSRRRDASKVALVWLVDNLRRVGFHLLDIQFITDHLARFGAVEIPREAYLRRLGAAVEAPVDWPDELVAPRLSMEQARGTNVPR